MSQAEEQLRHIYALLGTPGGIQEVGTLLHPDFELDEYSTGDASSRVYRGQNGFNEWAGRAVRSFTDATLEPLDVEEHGDKLLVTVQVRGTGASTGAPVDLVVHHVCEFRDGLLLRVGGHLDRSAARAAAAGLPPSA